MESIAAAAATATATAVTTAFRKEPEPSSSIGNSANLAENNHRTVKSRKQELHEKARAYALDASTTKYKYNAAYHRLQTTKRKYNAAHHCQLQKEGRRFSKESSEGVIGNSANLAENNRMDENRALLHHRKQELHEKARAYALDASTTKNKYNAAYYRKQKEGRTPQAKFKEGTSKGKSKRNERIPIPPVAQGKNLQQQSQQASLGTQPVQANTFLMGNNVHHLVQHPIWMYSVSPTGGIPFHANLPARTKPRKLRCKLWDANYAPKGNDPKRRKTDFQPTPAFLKEHLWSLLWKQQNTSSTNEDITPSINTYVEQAFQKDDWESASHHIAKHWKESKMHRLLHDQLAQGDVSLGNERKKKRFWKASFQDHMEIYLTKVRKSQKQRKRVPKSCNIELALEDIRTIARDFQNLQEVYFNEATKTISFSKAMGQQNIRFDVYYSTGTVSTRLPISNTVDGIPHTKMELFVRRKVSLQILRQIFQDPFVHGGTPPSEGTSNRAKQSAKHAQQNQIFRSKVHEALDQILKNDANFMQWRSKRLMEQLMRAILTFRPENAMNPSEENNQEAEFFDALQRIIQKTPGLKQTWELKEKEATKAFNPIPNQEIHETELHPGVPPRFPPSDHVNEYAVAEDTDEEEVRDEDDALIYRGLLGSL